MSQSRVAAEQVTVMFHHRQQVEKGDGVLK